MSGRRLAALAAAGLLWAGPAAAGPEVWESLGGSVNLPGVQDTVELSWTGSRWSGGASLAVSPSHSRLTPWLQWSPGPVFDVRLGLEPALYHGFSGALLGFPSREAAYDEDTRRARSDERLSGGGRAFVRATLRARVRRVLALGSGELERWRFSGDDECVYEPSRDLLLRRSGDTVLRTSVSLLHETERSGGRRLRLGLNHRLGWPTAAWDARVERLGLVAQWTLGERRLGVRQPTVALNLFRYLQDPYKQDEVGLEAGVRFRVR